MRKRISGFWCENDAVPVPCRGWRGVRLPGLAPDLHPSPAGHLTVIGARPALWALDRNWNENRKPNGEWLPRRREGLVPARAPAGVGHRCEPRRRHEGRGAPRPRPPPHGAWRGAWGSRWRWRPAGPRAPRGAIARPAGRPPVPRPHSQPASPVSEPGESWVPLAGLRPHTMRLASPLPPRVSPATRPLQARRWPCFHATPGPPDSAADLAAAGVRRFLGVPRDLQPFGPHPGPPSRSHSHAPVLERRRGQKPANGCAVCLCREGVTGTRRETTSRRLRGGG